MLRRAGVGRENGLFGRSDGGAHAAATIYTLVGSCKLQGIDPWAYPDLLDRIQDPGNRITALTPKGWAASRRGPAIAA